MLKIRLQRVGRKHQPDFRVMVTDSHNSTKSGKFIEIVGSFNAHKKGFTTLDRERVTYWLSQGAQATPRIYNMLIDEKVIVGKKVNVLPRKTPIKKAEALPAQAGPVGAATPQAVTSEAPTSAEEKKEEVVA